MTNIQGTKQPKNMGAERLVTMTTGLWIQSYMSFQLVYVHLYNYIYRATVVSIHTVYTLNF